MSALLQLHYYPSSYWSRNVALLVAEKRLEPERILVDIRKNANYAPEYLRLNPKGVVPTLVHDGNIICGGKRIAKHLDSIAGPPLSPDDPEVQHWVDALDAVPVMLFSYAVWVLGKRGERSGDILDDKVARAGQYAAKHPELRDAYERKQRYFADFRAQVRDEAHVAREKERCTSLLDEMGEQLKTRDWIAGDYSFADAIALSMLYRFDDLDQLCHWRGDDSHGLNGYYDRLRKRASFSAVFENDPLLELL
jgi:glutathione S-transferase